MKKFFGLGVAALTISTSMVMSAAPAQAFTGSLDITNFGLNGLMSGTATNVTATEDTLDFTPDNNNILASNGTGVFSGYNWSSIFDVSSLDLATVTNGLFIDLGTDLASAVDGIDGFTATQFSDIIVGTDGGSGSSLTVSFKGLFNIGGQEKTGAGNLTFQSSKSVATVESILASGGSIGPTTFSGLAATTVPEPATMLGLGLVAGAGFFASRRKQAEA